MKLTDEQLADILQASDKLIRNSLEFGQGTVHLQLRQHYAIARLTLALLSRVVLPDDHEKVASTLERYCVVDNITHMEFRSYLRDLEIGLKAAREETCILWTPTDIAQITARVVDAYDKASFPLPVGYAEALERLGYVTPAERYDPLRLTLQDCLPEPTLYSERQQMDTELRAALDRADPAQACALVLLLNINGRDRHCNVGVLRLLAMINAYLQSTAGRDARKSNDRTAKLIEQNFEAMLKELGLHVYQLPRPKIDPLASWKDILFHEIQVERADSDALMRSTIFPLEAALWQMMHNLEVEFDQADTLTIDLHVQHILLMLSALWCNETSPGSGISTIQRLAAHNLGVDPLWHWKEINRARWYCYNFEAPIALPYLIVTLTKIVNSPLPVHDADMRKEAQDLAEKAAGHLLACLRRMGIMLPDHALVRDYLESLGQLSSLPLPDTEVADLEVRAYRLFGTVDHATIRYRYEMRKAAQPATTIMAEYAEAELDDNIEPAYVAAARRLLTGKRVVMIGDAPDPARRQRLIDWFELASLDWIATDEYAHGTHARHRIEGKADILLLAIRWMGHAHSTLKNVARDLGIPCVYLPSGLNEQMVSMQVTRQMGGRPAKGSSGLKA